MMTSSNQEVPLTVAITVQARRKLNAFIAQCPQEISGLGTVEVVAGGLLITDVFLLQQEVTPSETVLPALTVAYFLATATDNGIDPSQLRLWWHSHATDQPYFSPTDLATITGTFDTSPWLLSYVGCHEGTYQARLDVFASNTTPVRLSKPVVIRTVEESSFTNEIDLEIKRLVTFPSPPPTRRKSR